MGISSKIALAMSANGANAILLLIQHFNIIQITDYLTESHPTPTLAANKTIMYIYLKITYKNVYMAIIRAAVFGLVLAGKNRGGGTGGDASCRLTDDRKRHSTSWCQGQTPHQRRYRTRQIAS